MWPFKRKVTAYYWVKVTSCKCKEAYLLKTGQTKAYFEDFDAVLQAQVDELFIESVSKLGRGRVSFDGYISSRYAEIKKFAEEKTNVAV